MIEAVGYAFVTTEGALLVQTVSPTEFTCKVNTLVLVYGKYPSPLHTNETIEKGYDDLSLRDCRGKIEKVKISVVSD